MRPQIICLLLLVVFSSCMRDLNFDLQQGAQKIVVNALFSEDKPWAVQLNYTKDASDSSDRFIEDARVTILSGSDEIILSHIGKGRYTSDLYPKVNVMYELKVEIPGKPVVTASSSAPEKPQCVDLAIGENWSKYMFQADLMDYDVLPVSLHIKNEDQRFWVFDMKMYRPEFQYYISEFSIQNMRKKKVPDDILARLEGLVGQYFDSQYKITESIRDFNKKYNSVEMSEFEHIILDEVVEKKKEQYNPERFFPISIFSNSNWLSNISSHSYLIAGENEKNNEASLFLGDPNLAWQMQHGNGQNNEYWLNARTCSVEYYQYLRTYILQVSQRMNPYVEPIEVYSNIKNGIGIFAGYSEQSIHLFDY